MSGGLAVWAREEYGLPMTRDQAIAEAARRQEAEPGVTWIATERAGEWTLARVGMATRRPTGTATQPAPMPPRDDPHSPSERAAWFAAGG